MSITYEQIVKLIEGPNPENIASYDAVELATTFSESLPALLAESTNDNDLVEMLFDFWVAALSTAAAPKFADVFFEETDSGFRRINMLKPARCKHSEWYRGIRRTMEAIEEKHLAPYQKAASKKEDIWEFSITGAAPDDPDMLISKMLSAKTTETERLPHSMICHKHRTFDGGDTKVSAPREDVFYVISEQDLFSLWESANTPDCLDLFANDDAKLYSRENDCRTLIQLKHDIPEYRVIV